MGTRFETTACPLCTDEFDDAVEFKEHLAFMHDLEDDEGAETTLHEVTDEPVDLEAAPEPAPVVVGPVDPIDALPFTPPVRSRVLGAERVLTGLIAAVAIQLVIALLGLAVVDGGSDEKVTAAAGASSPAAGATTGDADAAAAAGADHPAGAQAAPSAAGPKATTPPTTAAPVIDTSGDQARADAFALRASDFPAGWEALDPNDLADEGSEDTGPDCTVENDPTETDALTAETDTGFVHDMSFVFGGALMLRTEKDAIRTMTVFRQLSTCFGESFLQGIRDEGATVTHGEFSSMGYPTYGDETTALSMPVTVSGPEGKFPFRLDLLAVRRDRAVGYVMVIVGANDFTPQAERGMLSAVAARMSPRPV